MQGQIGRIRVPIRARIDGEFRLGKSRSEFHGRMDDDGPDPQFLRPERNRRQGWASDRSITARRLASGDSLNKFFVPPSPDTAALTQKCNVDGFVGFTVSAVAFETLLGVISRIVFA